MSDIKETTVRCLAMLRIIPVAPGGIDVAGIEERLSDQGYSISRRQIQRDLRNLSMPFPIREEKKEGSKANIWFWMEGTEVMDIPKMDPQTALTFTLVEAFLKKVLPVSILNNLDPHFKRAKGILSGLLGEHPYKWYEKIRIIPRGQALVSPPVDRNILETLHEALRLKKQIKVLYQTRGAEKPKEYIIHPLGLVFKHELVYLVGTLWSYDDIKQLALHRFKSAEIINSKGKKPKHFDLDKYILEGEFSYPVNEKPIKLHLAFAAGAIGHLFESPLAADQKITKQKDGRFLLKATVKETSELHWWLLGFGDNVEVIKPKALRKQFAGTFSNLATMYADE